jgi:hypothetical protein
MTGDIYAELLAKLRVAIKEHLTHMWKGGIFLIATSHTSKISNSTINELGLIELNYYNY